MTVSLGGSWLINTTSPEVAQTCEEFLCVQVTAFFCACRGRDIVKSELGGLCDGGERVGGLSV